MREQTADILIIGSGIGGACMAAGLSTSGASVVILERGEQLPSSPHARSARTIFVDEHYRPEGMWRGGAGRAV